RDEVLGDSPLPGLDQVETALGRWIDGCLLERMQRPLRERRERPDRLHIVAEELDPNRLPPRGGEHVDDSAAYRELPPLFRALDALVAGQRERRRELVDPGLVAHLDVEPGRARLP